MSISPTVFVVDDDPEIRASMQLLIAAQGINVEVFADAGDFLQRFDPTRWGCLLLDIRMPGISGLELQQQLRASGIDIPIIMMTGHGNVPTVIEVMKTGATDFLQKPFDYQALLQAVSRGLELDRSAHEERARRLTIRTRIAKLTSRQQEVMEMVVKGVVNRQIAATLGLSPKTIEFHRTRVMKKMDAGSLLDLVRMVGVVRQSPQASE